MNQADFDLVVSETIESIQKLLKVKGGEYAGSEDLLANFKRGAGLVGVTPLQVLFIYLSKHYDAVATYVRVSSQGNTPTLSEPIEGRFDDIINYCILAKALIRDSAVKAVIGPGNFSVHSDRVRGSDDCNTIFPTARPWNSTNN